MKQVQKLKEQHGMYRTPEYNTWDSMVQRCTNPANESYKGVYFDKRPKYKYRKWYAEVKRNYKKTYVGHFSTPEEAHQARLELLEAL